MRKIPECFEAENKKSCLNCCAVFVIVLQREFATFGWGPQGEIYWTGFSASPDVARAEGAPVTTEAAHLCPSTSLKKVRPYLFIWWCWSMYKAFSQCWVGVLLLGSDSFQATGAGQNLTGHHGQERFCCAPGCWVTCAPSCPVPCCLSCSCCCKTATVHDFIPTWRCCICQNVNSEMPVTKLCMLHNSLKNSWICAECFYPEFKSWLFKFSLWNYVISEVQQVFISFSRSANIIDKLFLKVVSGDLYWCGIIFCCHRK